MQNTRIFNMPFASVYPLYITKVEKKGRTKAQVDEVILWLTGYDLKGLQKQIDDRVSFEKFFAQAPILNPNVSKITGVICGYRVEKIEDPLMQKIRYMDILIDKLARNKSFNLASLG